MLNRLEKIQQYHLAGLHYRVAKEFELVFNAAKSNLSQLLLLGSSCVERGDYSRALDVLECVENILNDGNIHSFQPIDANELNLFRAKVFAGVGNVAESKKYYEQINPVNSSHHVRWNLALNDLLNGNYQRGWQLYEERFSTHSNRVLHVYPFRLPRWDGVFRYRGNILIHGEQGLGDEIMFASFLGELINRATPSKTTIYLASSLPTYELFKYSFPSLIHLSHFRGPQDVDAWEQAFEPPWLKDMPVNTMHLPMGSLPLMLSMDLPSGRPYLVGCKKDKDRFKKLLNNTHGGVDLKHKLLVGLAWCANLRTSYGEEKSVALEHFVRLTQNPNFCFVGIQGPEYGGQVGEVSELKMVDFHGKLQNLNKVASLVLNLDAIVSVDTSYAHLAGALGIPCITLLKKNHDWRFGLNDSNPFYQKSRLFRQAVEGSWDEPIDQVAYELSVMQKKLL